VNLDYVPVNLASAMATIAANRGTLRAIRPRSTVSVSAAALVGRCGITRGEQHTVRDGVTEGNRDGFLLRGTECDSGQRDKRDGG
jgi:hypothetical protein